MLLSRRDDGSNAKSDSSLSMPPKMAAGGAPAVLAAAAAAPAVPPAHAVASSSPLERVRWHGVPPPVGGSSDAANSRPSAATEPAAAGPSAATGPSTSPVSAINSQQLRSRLIRFFSRYEPTQCLIVDQWMMNWRGREAELIAALVDFHGPEPSNVLSGLPPRSASPVPAARMPSAAALVKSSRQRQLDHCRSLLQQVVLTYEPEKYGSIDSRLSEWELNLPVLEQLLEQQLAMRDLVLQTMQSKMPSRMAEAPALLREWFGHEPQLLKLLGQYPGTEDDDATRKQQQQPTDGAPAAGAAAAPSPPPIVFSRGPNASAPMPFGDAREQVTQIYRYYNPSKLHEVDDLLRQYDGREDALMRSLRRKYMSGAAASGAPGASTATDPSSPSLHSSPAAGGAGGGGPRGDGVSSSRSSRHHAAPSSEHNGGPDHPTLRGLEQRVRQLESAGSYSRQFSPSTTPARRLGTSISAGPDESGWAFSSHTPPSLLTQLNQRRVTTTTAASSPLPGSHRSEARSDAAAARGGKGSDATPLSMCFDSSDPVVGSADPHAFSMWLLQQGEISMEEQALLGVKMRLHEVTWDVAPALSEAEWIADVGLDRSLAQRLLRVTALLSSRD